MFSKCPELHETILSCFPQTVIAMAQLAEIPVKYRLRSALEHRALLNYYFPLCQPCVSALTRKALEGIHGFVVIFNRRRSAPGLDVDSDMAVP